MTTESPKVRKLIGELAAAIRADEKEAGELFAQSLASHMEANRQTPAGMFEEEKTTTTEKARTFNEP